MSDLQSGGVFNISDDGLTFGVIGPGKLGFALITALLKQKALGWVVCRTEATAMRIAEQFDWNVMPVTDMQYVPELPDIVMLTVPDTEIPAVATTLSGMYGSQLAGKVVMHCSGALGRGALAACGAFGARTIAAHPFQTFATSSDVAFRGITWGIECAEADREIIASIVRRFEGNPVFLSEYTCHNRGLYHAAAVFGSNFLTMLIATAKETAAAAGIEPMEFLLPIITTAAENSLQALDSETTPPLTGPVARGDADTVERHLEQFAETAPHLGFEYALLARATAELARRHGFIMPEQYRNLRAMLDEAITAFRPTDD